jgi:hypothetical protein
LSFETNRTELNAMLPRGLEIEGCALSTASGTIDKAPRAPPNRPLRLASPNTGAWSIVQWFAIAALLTLAGLETFASFAAEVGGVLWR